MSDHPVTAPASESEARAIAEAARETEWTHPSFVRELFLGRFRLELIHPHPPEDPAEAARAKPFLDELKAFLERYDADEVDRTGHIREEDVQRLREMGAFGIKVPREYGGLGLSPTSYAKAMAIITSRCGSLGALLSAAPSLRGPPPPQPFR